MTLALKDIDRCFHGIVPSFIATCSRDGVPNVTYVSHVYYVDDRHVALSCQFFNKTRQNVEVNPFACVEVNDPVTFETYRLYLRYDHSETSGPLFEEMKVRLQAIASHAGMAGIFRLLAADVYELLSLERVDEFIEPSDPAAEELPEPAARPTELRGLHLISSRINCAATLDELLTSTLNAMAEALGFEYAMVLLLDESGQRLITLATHGYSENSVGAEVEVGEGLIGTVAQQRKIVRLGAVDAELRYQRAIRTRALEVGNVKVWPEVPLAGLPDAQSQLILPLMIGERLIGVLAVESHHAGCFDEWHETFLNIVANQIAIAIDRLTARDENEERRVATPPPPRLRSTTSRTRRFCFYGRDECILMDGEYLIRRVPAMILWKVLTLFQREGRTEFSNRELRLDPSLGLPQIKDNLESRLILLRKRLEQKCPEVRIVPAQRGWFTLEVGCGLELSEAGAEATPVARVVNS